MMIKNGVVQIHAVRSYVSKKTQKVVGLADCTTGEDEKERYLSIYMDEPVFKILEKGFIADKNYSCDFEFRTFKTNGYLKIVAIHK